MYKLVEVTTIEGLRKLYDGSALTFEGTVVDEKNAEFLVNWLKEAGTEPAEDLVIYTFKGKLMNDTFELTNDNRYPDDLTSVSIELNQLGNWSPLTTKRFELGGRWMDDVIDNNLFREGKSAWDSESK